MHVVVRTSFLRQLRFKSACSSQGRSLAVVGPHAITRAGLLSGYAGDSWCYTDKYDGSHKETNCIPPIGESLAKVNVGGATTIVEGVPVRCVLTFQ